MGTGQKQNMKTYFLYAKKYAIIFHVLSSGLVWSVCKMFCIFS